MLQAGRPIEKADVQIDLPWLGRWYPLARRLSGPQIKTGRYAKKKNLALSRIEPGLSVVSPYTDCAIHSGHAKRTVSQAERWIFWEVILSTNVSREGHMYLCPKPNGFRAVSLHRRAARSWANWRRFGASGRRTRFCNSEAPAELFAPHKRKGYKESVSAFTLHFRSVSISSTFHSPLHAALWGPAWAQQCLKQLARKILLSPVQAPPKVVPPIVLC
jgi:hypothetical protein